MRTAMVSRKTEQMDGWPRKPDDGYPYYCDMCGAGYREFLACDRIFECRLETEREAETRRQRVLSAGE